MVLKRYKLNELASVERSNGNIFPSGSSLVQISATKGQVLYLSQTEAVDPKYAVVIPNEIVLPRYLYMALSNQSPRYFHATQVGLNIVVDDLKKLPLIIDTDLEKQKEAIERFEVIEQLEKTNAKMLNNLKEVKKTTLSEFFI